MQPKYTAPKRPWGRGKFIAPAIRFAPKVIRADVGCWEWNGGVDTAGYGKFWNGKRRVRASRFAWELVTGDVLTEDDNILHTCDNPPCTRNDDIGVYVVNGRTLPRRGHLVKGTRSDNSRDMDQKGRRVPPHMIGVANPNVKLTEVEAMAILLLKDSGQPASVVAPTFGVTSQLVRLIWQRKSWKHLDLVSHALNNGDC